jgi:hypothetical protein
MMKQVVPRISSSLARTYVEFNRVALGFERMAF